MPGDVDNIVKPILDVLGRHIYVDDAQVERVVVEKFEPKNVFAFRAPSPTHRKCGASPEAGALHTTEQRSIRGLDMNEVEQSRQVLDQLIRTSKRKGIRYVHPSRDLLPPFMKGYAPDAIALGPKKIWQ
jgi:endodeoxyribonuclease RusA/REase_AHJR-like protein